MALKIQVVSAVILLMYILVLGDKIQEACPKVHWVAHLYYHDGKCSYDTAHIFHIITVS